MSRGFVHEHVNGFPGRNGRRWDDGAKLITETRYRLAPNRDLEIDYLEFYPDPPEWGDHTHTCVVQRTGEV